MSLRSERAAIVKAVHVHAGSQVQAKDLLPEFEEKRTFRRGFCVTPVTHMRRFGSWGQALTAFVAFVNADESADDIAKGVGAGERAAGKMPRDPSLRLRFKVLQHDLFRCTSCGASSALTPGIVLHVDHHLPWSKGGDTVLEHLKTLREPCSLGKANLSTMP